MSLLQRLDRAAALFGLEPKATRGRRGNDTLPGWWQTIGHMGEYGEGIPDVSLYAAQADKYLKTPAFYAAVNRLAEAAAMAPAVVRDGSASDAKLLPEHPFLDLLRRPVWNMEWLSLDRFTVIESIVGSLGVNGNAYLYLGARPVGWPPTMLLPLRPDRLWPRPDRQQGLKGYTYEINGRKWELDTRDVLHLRRWHPTNDFVGLSPVEPANYAIATDLAAQKHNWATFKNGARLSVVVESDAEHVDLEDKKNMEQYWIDTFTGNPEQAHKIAFLWGGFKAKDWGINARDAEYVEGRKLNRMDMLMASGIHPALLMAEDVNLCHDDETEVLTDRGWLTWHELNQSARVACVEPQTGVLSYHVPSRIYINPHYKGQMCHVRNANTEFMVTPEHTCLYQIYDGPQTNSIPWRLNSAEIMLTYGRIRVRVSAHQQPTGSLDQFRLPGLYHQSHQTSIGNEDLYIFMGDWITLVALYVTEGCIHEATFQNKRYWMTITQKQGPGANFIRDLLGRLPFKWREYTNDEFVVTFTLSGKSLVTWMHDHCGVGSDNKRLPRLLLDILSVDQLRLLWDIMIFGDGTADKRPNRQSGMYGSKSLQLIDDMQELAVRLGIRTNINGPYAKHHDWGAVSWTWALNWCARDTTLLNFVGDEEHPVSASWEDYDGVIWCVEVPTGVFVTRRNGRIAIQGNSNARVAEYLFAKYTLQPALLRLAGRFNAEILPNYGEGHTFGFENVVPRDDITEAQTEQARGAALVELVRALGPAEGVAEAQRKGLISADVQGAHVVPMLSSTSGGPVPTSVPAGEMAKTLTATETTDLAALAEEYGRAAQLLAGVLTTGDHGNGRHG